MVAANASDTLICARLKRSPEAIRMRLLKLQKRRKEKTDDLAPEMAGISPQDEL
jgi:hypothetical protein